MRTLHTIFSCVAANVAFQIKDEVERPRTGLALELLVVRVRLLMAGQMTQTCKVFSTLGTDERFLAGMNVHMRLQFVSGAELFGAFRTVVGLSQFFWVPFEVGSHVFLQTTVLPKRFVAIWFRALVARLWTLFALPVSSGVILQTSLKAKQSVAPRLPALVGFLFVNGFVEALRLTYMIQRLGVDRVLLPNVNSIVLGQ